MLLRLLLKFQTNRIGLVIVLLLLSSFAHASTFLTVGKVKAELEQQLSASNGDPTYVIHQYSREKLHRPRFHTQSDWIRSLRYAESLAAAKKGSFYLRFCVDAAQRLRENNLFKEAYFFLYKANNRQHLFQFQRQHTRFRLYEELGLSYYYFKRFSEAEVQFHYARREASNDYERIGLYNTLGLIKREMGSGDSSRIYFEKALFLAKKVSHKPWVAVISGNLGNYYWKVGNLQKARQLCERDYQFSLETGQNGSAFSALCLLLEMDLKQEFIDQAQKKLKLLEEMMGQSGYNISEYRLYYRARTAFLEATGDHKGALISYRKVVLYSDTIRQRTDMENSKKTEFQVDFERKQAEISVLHEKKKNGEIVIYGLVFLTIIIISVFLVFLNMFAKRRKREREIATLKQQKISRELEDTEREMRVMLTNLMEKNALIERLTEEIHQFQSASQEIPEEKLKLLEKLHSFSLLTDDDWLDFKRLFERLNPNFFARLQQSAPDLTNAEIRLVTLLKLNLSNLEISRALGISADSVRKTSLRLRKKLSIELHEELVRFALSL